MSGNYTFTGAAGQELPANNQGKIASGSDVVLAELYMPGLVSSNGQDCTTVGPVTAWRIGDLVRVKGTLIYTQQAAAGNDSITIEVPTNMEPVANFAAATDATGSCVIQTAPFSDQDPICTPPVAYAGTKKVALGIVTASNWGQYYFAFTFDYAIQ